MQQQPAGSGLSRAQTTRGKNRLAKAGKIRVLGVSTTRRLTGLENVPTIAESGVSGYEMSSWYGVFTSGGTPAKVAAR